MMLPSGTITQKMEVKLKRDEVTKGLPAEGISDSGVIISNVFRKGRQLLNVTLIVNSTARLFTPRHCHSHFFVIQDNTVPLGGGLHLISIVTKDTP